MTCSYCTRHILDGEPYDESPMGPITHLSCLPVFLYHPPIFTIAAPRNPVWAMRSRAAIKAWETRRKQRLAA